MTVRDGVLGAVLLLVCVAMTIAIAATTGALRDTEIQSCRGSARPLVAQLNFDYGVYSADFRSARDPTVSEAERANRSREAWFLLSQTKLRASRVSVAALALRGRDRLIDPTIRAEVGRIDFRCDRAF